MLQINIHTSPDSYNSNDFVADLGKQWIPSEGVDTMQETKASHEEAGKMFKEILEVHMNSASDLLLYFSNLYLNAK